MGIDFHTYSLKIAKGRELPAGENILVTASSLKSHRHRKGEILALLLDYRQISEDFLQAHDGMLQKAGNTFFTTPGSVTNALQRTAGTINSIMLDYNLQAGSAEPVEAAACFAVSHNGYLFTAQIGSPFVFHIGAESFTCFQAVDPNERGLGASRRFSLNFQQTRIEPGDLIILSTKSPSTWDEEHLKGSCQVSMDQVHRRLMNQPSIDLTAAVLKCREGKGTVQEEKWIEEPAPILPKEELIEKNDGITSDLKIEDQDKAEAEIEEQEVIEREDISTKEDSHGKDLIQEFDIDDLSIQPGRPEKALSEEPKEVYEKNPYRVQKNEFARKIPGNEPKGEKSKTAEALKDFFIKIGRRITAESNSQEGSKPSRLLSALVIAIPFILITLAVTVYIYSGRREQHNAYLEETKSYITQASTIEDTVQQRDYWAKAYETVLQAMEFGDSDLADNLLTQTQTIIDDMDLVTRLDFRPATTSQYPADVALTKIKSNDSGIYLLDSTAGRIYRTVANSKGFYEIDSSFQCGPGTYGVVAMGKIVDFTMLPTNTRSYELLAVDGGGNLLYCSPDNEPVPSSLIPADGGWGEVTAVSLDEYTLYVLDSENDRIWSYAGHDFEISAMAGIVFSGHPVDFLGTEELDLGGALDLIVNKEDIFVLHEDSHMTTCQYNAYRDGNATECSDPTAYSDSRIGYEKNPLVYFDSQFRVIQETTYPNSAFYILDAARGAVLQYSYQLNLERTLKPQPSKTYPLPDAAMTGLGVSTEKEIFLAFGNQLYVGDLP